MMTIEQDECMKLILSKVPEFEAAWRDHLNYWEGEEAGLSNDVAEFSRFVVRNIATMEEAKKQEVFSLIEFLLTEGDEVVKTAVATCFLENLMNAMSANRLSHEDFVPFLRKKSRAHCKAWDEFTGVTTPGL